MTEIIQNSEGIYVPTKDQKYVVVSKMAYLLGVWPESFTEDGCLKKEIYNQMQMYKPARIIRNLTTIRTSIERGYKRIQEGLILGKQSVFLMDDVIPQWAVEGLTKDGVKVPFNAPLADALIFVNTQINDRINNCRRYLPDWLNWEYIRDLFIMPNGTTPQGCLESAKVYYKHMNAFPYRVYINLDSDPEVFLFQNDKTFVTQIYYYNNDDFTDLGKVQDLSEHLKSSIYEFIDKAERIVMIADCENSDPYNLICALKGLKWENALEKVAKIILINDKYASTSWSDLSSYTDIPVEHLMTERVKGNKSLVDGTLISKVFLEFYEEHTDSFILLSSDSDYWALIKMLSKASFLVMAEHDKCGPDLINAFSENQIKYCFLDDFYSGDGETAELKKEMLMRNLIADISSHDFNIKELFEHALKRMRLDMPDREQRQFYAEYLKNLKISIADDGRVLHTIKR